MRIGRALGERARDQGAAPRPALDGTGSIKRRPPCVVKTARATRFGPSSNNRNREARHFRLPRNAGRLPHLLRRFLGLLCRPGDSFAGRPTRPRPSRLTSTRPAAPWPAKWAKPSGPSWAKTFANRDSLLTSGIDI